MNRQSKWYVSTNEIGESFILDTDLMNLYVHPVKSVVLEDEEALNEFEHALVREEEEVEFDFEEYFDEHFEMDDTYFRGETDDDVVEYEKAKALVERGVLYDLEKERFVTMEELDSWERSWGYWQEGEPILYDEGQPVEVINLPGESKPRVFKAFDEDVYYTWKAVGEEDEVIVVEDEDEIELIQLSKEKALEEIAKRYNLSIEYGCYEYWDHQPYFVTKEDDEIWAVESGVFKGHSYLAHRDIPELLQEIRCAMAM